MTVINPGLMTLINDTWLERSALQSVGVYSLKAAPHVKAAVYFVWLSQWDTERDVSERLADLPGAVSRISAPGFPGSVVLIGADRWAVARALPMAVESLRASGVEPAHVAAWTYAGGWQAASGASMLDGAARPFTPTLATVRLGRMKLETVINGCPWTRRDSSTLYPFFNRMAEHIGCSIAHCAALGGKSEKDRLAWRCMRTLIELGLVREAGIAGVANLPARARSQFFSERGQGQMRYRVSLSRKEEEELAEGQAGKSRQDHTRPTANGADRLRLSHGHLSYREIVRRSGLGKLQDRLGDRRVHDDILLDLLGHFCLMGCEVVPTSRASTVTLDGQVIESDAVIYCSSPVGTGHHRFELERSHLGPAEIRARLEKYARRFIPYPLLVVCGTDLGARHFNRIGQELGVPVVATSIRRLREMGFSGPAWSHQGQEVAVSPVPCPPQPATPPPPPAAL